MSIVANAVTRLEVETTPGTWTPIQSDAKTITVNRADSDPGTLVAEVLNAALDPTTSTTLRTGKAVRLRTVEGSGWRTIYGGTIDDVSVEYNPLAPTGKRANVKISATDNVSFLANRAEARGVGTVDGLRWLLNGSGVGFLINGSSTTLSTGTVVATNDGASLWDQILITRDTALGYAWVDMENRLRVYDSASMDTGLKASITSANYRDIDTNFTSDQIINTVTVNWRRYNIGTETSADVPYGPYVDASSVAQWGTHSATYTIQGATEVASDIQAYAQRVLTRNANAEVRARSVTIPLNTVADLAYARNIDLHSRINVTFTNGTTTKTLRVIGISHEITTSGWLLTLSLATPEGATVPSVTPGTGNAYNPPGTIEGYQLAPGSVTKDKVAFNFRDLDGTTTFSQADQPTNAKAGDLWIKTSDKNRLYRYSGSSWVEVRDLTIKDAETAAANAAAAAVGAQSTANGATSVASAAQSTADTAKTNAATAQTTANNARAAADQAAADLAAVQVGGANLFVNSSFDNPTNYLAGWGKATTSGASVDRETTIVRPGSTASAKLTRGTNTSGGNYGLIQNNGSAVPLKAGQKVVVSFWYYATRAGQNINVDMTGVVRRGIYVTEIEKWVRLVYPMTAPSDGNFVVRIYNDNGDPSDVIYIDDAQFEEGTVATAWKPSLAELQAAADAADAKAVTAQSNAATAQTAANSAASAAATAQTTANNAASAASAAQSTATAAQTSANGKNKITYSTAAPGSTANTAGDTWFQFSGPLVVGQYKGNGGTSWTAQTLDSAVIANLDAGKFTAGSSFTNALNVKTNFTLGDANTDGVIQSYNFANSPTGVFISKAGIVAKGGTLSGTAVTGATITGGILQTATSGQRIVIRQDNNGGIIEMYSGVGGETPGYLDPSSNGSLPRVVLAPGTTSSAPGRPSLSLSSQNTPNGEASLVASRLYISAQQVLNLGGPVYAESLAVGNGTHRVQSFGKGEFTGNTNSSAQVTVFHGMGQTPTSVSVTVKEAQGGSGRHQITVTSTTSTSITFTVRNASAGLVNSTTGFYWQAWA